jgi:hypothetical protein
LVYKPPGDNGEELKLEDIVDRIKKTGHSAEGFDNMQKGTTLLERNINKDSVVLILSSGGFVPISPKFRFYRNLATKSRILDLSAPTSNVGGQIGNGFIDLTVKWLESKFPM